MSAPDQYADRVLDAALTLAAAGVAVFPVRVRIVTDDQGRRCKDVAPIGAWRQASSTEPAVVHGWYGPGGRWRGASLAIDCGKSALVVVDCDGATGIAAWDRLGTEHTTAATWVARTPGGGTHWYYAADPDHPVGIDSSGKVADHVDVRGDGGFVIVAPSRDERGAYTWVEGVPEWGALPVRPTVVADRMAARRDRGAARSPSLRPAAAPGGPVPRAYADAAYTEVITELAATTHGRNAALNGAAYRLGRFVAAGALTEAEVRDGLERASDLNGYLAKDGSGAVTATLCSGLESGMTDPHPGPATRRAPAAARPVRTTLVTPDPPAETPDTSPSQCVPGVMVGDGDPAALLRDLLDQLRTWHHLDDAAHIVAALAAAATSQYADIGEEAAWLLIVSVPSSGKTEATNLLGPIADERMDQVTVAGLLSWSGRGRTAVPTGVLTRVQTGLITIGDLSTLLASSDRGGRDEVFSVLRRVYDGHVTRALNPAPLTWIGHVNLVGACTRAIDRYSAHDAALGSRWLLVRLPDRDTAQRREAAALARRATSKMRIEAARLAQLCVQSARARAETVVVPDAVEQTIEDAALVLCWGRASVPRNGYGRREITGQADVEEPMRIIQQLGLFARGLLALGLDVEQTIAVCRRLALDSMPGNRRAVLEALVTLHDTPPIPAKIDATGIEPDNVDLGGYAAPEITRCDLRGHTTARVAREARMHRHVAAMVLEELELIGLVVDSAAPTDLDGIDADGYTDDPRARRASWRLADSPDAALLAQVVRGPHFLSERTTGSA